MRILSVVIALLLLAPLMASGVGGGMLWDLLNGAGFAACALFVYLSWLSASPARQPGLDAHADLALWICAFASLHAAGLLVAEPTLLEYFEAGAPLYMIVGTGAFVLLLALTWASFPTARQRVWKSWPSFRSWHRWLWLVLLVAIAWHVLGAGFYLDTDPARLLALTVLVLLPLAFWLDRRMRSGGAPDHRPAALFNPLVGLGAVLATVLFAALQG